MDNELREAIAAYIAPLSDAEVAAIEADYQANLRQIDPERDVRQRAHLERLRRVWLAGYQAGRRSVPELSDTERDRLITIGLEVFREVMQRLEAKQRPWEQGKNDE